MIACIHQPEVVSLMAQMVEATRVGLKNARIQGKPARRARNGTSHLQRQKTVHIQKTSKNYTWNFLHFPKIYECFSFHTYLSLLEDNHPRTASEGTCSLGPCFSFTFISILLSRVFNTTGISRWLSHTHLWQKNEVSNYLSKVDTEAPPVGVMLGHFGWKWIMSRECFLRWNFATYCYIIYIMATQICTVLMIIV